MKWDREEEESYVAFMYACGFTTREIERATHHDRKTTIRRIIKKFNIPFRFHADRYHMWRGKPGMDINQLCACGCGKPVHISRKTSSRTGIVKGQPFTFIHNHHALGKRHTEESKEKLRKKRWGENNPHWKGNDVLPGAGRQRAKRRFPVLGQCELCRNPALHRHHKDSNTNNNSAENIQMLCPRHHMTVDGRIEKIKHYRKVTLRGEQQKKAKLKDRDVIKIRALLKEGNLSQVQIAGMFGVCKSRIWFIKTGKSWNHVPDDVGGINESMEICLQKSAGT